MFNFWIKELESKVKSFLINSLKDFTCFRYTWVLGGVFLTFCVGWSAFEECCGPARIHCIGRRARSNFTFETTQIGYFLGLVFLWRCRSLLWAWMFHRCATQLQTYRSFGFRFGAFCLLENATSCGDECSTNWLYIRQIGVWFLYFPPQAYHFSLEESCFNLSSDWNRLISPWACDSDLWRNCDLRQSQSHPLLSTSDKCSAGSLDTSKPCHHSLSGHDFSKNPTAYHWHEPLLILPQQRCTCRSWLMTSTNSGEWPSHWLWLVKDYLWSGNWCI